MGKVLEKLTALPIVKSITDVNGQHMVVLNNGLEKLCPTAHAARLFIQEHAPKAPGKARASRSVAPSATGADGEASATVTPIIPEIRVPKYPGMRVAAERAGEEYVVIPLSQRAKGFSANEAEGLDAFRRGYDRKSHYYGESSAAKEFELAWEQARRAAEAAAEAAAKAA